MTFRKQVALPTTLTDLLVARQDAMRLIEDSHRTLQKAEEVLAPYGHNLMPYEAQPRESLDRIRKELDGKMWRRAMDLTGFKQLMDADEADKFEKSLFPSPAEFTDANVRATFIDLQIRSEEMFRRGCSTYSAISPTTTAETRPNPSAWVAASSCVQWCAPPCGEGSASATR